MAVNLKFPLQKGSDGPFATNDSTLQAVADDLRILLLTNYGERPVHYDFGANLRGLIFEHQGDELKQAVKDRIVNAVERWMPFVSIVNIQVDNDNSRAGVLPNEIAVKIEFSVGDIDITYVLNQRIKM